MKNVRGWCFDRLRMVVLAGLVLAGCASQDAATPQPSADNTSAQARAPAHARAAPLPPATVAQIEKEMRYLKQHFLTDACMKQLRAAAPALQSPEKLNIKTIYAVEFPPNSQARDGRAYRLHVSEPERLAYLHTSGGSAGWYTVHGPLPLWQCMHRGLQ